MASTQDPRTRLQERGRLLLGLLRRGKRAHQRDILLWGGLRILAGLAVGAAAWLVASGIWPTMPRVVGAVVAAALWTGVAALVWRHWIRPLRAVPNLAVFSRRVEEKRDFRDMLRAALEFVERGAPTGGSVELVAATVDRAYEEASQLQLTRLFPFHGRGRHAATVIVAGGVALAAAALVPDAGRRALQGLAFAYPTPASIAYGDLEVASGNLSVLAGEDVLVRVRDHGPLAPEMVLRFNDTGDLWKTRTLQPLARRGDGQPWEYVYRFEDVRDATLYRFESMGRRTPDFRIDVVQRPIVARFSLRLTPPAYTGREPVTLEEGRGDAIALLGTEVEIEGTASTPLRLGLVVPGDEEGGAPTLPEPLPMHVDGTSFSARFTLRSDVSYHFEILDTRGNENADPVTYRIAAVEDRPPWVELQSPDPESEIPKSMQVELRIHASDDFGIRRMTLAYATERDGEELEGSAQRQRLRLRGPTATDTDGKPLGSEPAPEVLKTFAWDLAALGLFPGDVVTYHVEVQDNDAFSGFKSARTPTYRLRLPTLGELYTRIQEKDDERIGELDEVIRKGREVREKFEKMARELKKDPNVDWKKQQEIDRTLEKQKELAKKVQDIAENMQQELDRMEEQQLVSEEIARKMEQIRQLMEEVQDDRLREYMERLQKLMQEISPEEIQRAMEEMQLSQEEFLQRLERTRALLEQLKREQQLDALVEKTSDLLRRQEELTDRTEDLEKQMREGDEKSDAEKSDKDDASKSDAERDKDASENAQDDASKNDDAAKQDGDSQKNEASESDEQQNAEADKQAERLAEEQGDLSEEARKLQEEIEKLAEELQQQGQSEMNEAQESVEQQPPSEEMQEASKQLQQRQPSQAQQNQQSAERQLRMLYEQLMQAQQMMSMNMQAEVAEALLQAARQSLDVSFRQEHLAREEAPMGDFETNGDLARTQKALRSATDRVVGELDELGRKSLLVPPHIMALLGEATQKMDKGVAAYEKGNPHAARVHGEAAYADLNRVVIELNRSSKSCSGGGGSPRSSSRERMQQMMQRQQQLNDATRQFHDRLPNPGNMSPEERARMSRLLGEQQAIQQELQDIERQAAEERDLLGRLDELQKEMQEVIEDMDSEALSEETLRVQERIVSRMLQAQRSLHKRDYNKERESRAVEEVFSQGGKELPKDELREKLRREIQRALESGTPEEYQELVRLYFKAIAEAEDTPPQENP